jgi:hypothetical protein
VLLESIVLYEKALNSSQKEFSMRLHSKALAMAMAATLPLASGMAASLHATTPLLGKSNRSMPCEHNSHVDSSLRVCITDHDGIVRYQIDAVDGTHAELILSESAVELRQSGPDSVRVSLGVHADASRNATPSGITRTVYRDTVLSINEVQEDGLPPKWWLDLGSGMQPVGKTCDTAACSGSFRQYTDMSNVLPAIQPAQKSCPTDSCSGHIQQHMDMPPTMQTTQ